MDELLKALKLIKQTCARQECCKVCPLRVEDMTNGKTCELANKNPDQWDLKETNRVFK